MRQRVAESAPEPAEVLSRAAGAECISANSSPLQVQFLFSAVGGFPISTLWKEIGIFQPS